MSTTKKRPSGQSRSRATGQNRSRTTGQSQSRTTGGSRSNASGRSRRGTAGKRSTAGIRSTRKTSQFRRKSGVSARRMTGKSSKRKPQKKFDISDWRVAVPCIVVLLFLCVLSERLYQAQQEKIAARQEKQRQEQLVRQKKRAKKIDARKIRVLIKTDGYEALLHREVVITCDKAFYYKKDGVRHDCSAGEQIYFSMGELGEDGSQTVRVGSDHGRLQLSSITRTCGHPSYRGVLDITGYEDGLAVVSQVTLGQYLYSVVSSEIGTGSPLEALKAQAICARSYALRQLDGNRYPQYQADLDDSTTFQVYNNIAETKSTIRAVRQTVGQVLLYKNNLAATYYYATSWGHSADASEVWGGEEKYLTGRWQLRDGKEKTTADQAEKEVDLSDNQDFEEFIRKCDWKMYDSDDIWYRWNAHVNLSEISARSGVANVTGVEVTGRTKSGLVKEIRIIGDTSRVISDTTVMRRILQISDGSLTLTGGLRQAGQTMLPSNAFYVRVAGDRLMVYGGGFGHGIGMSQSGACTMAKDHHKADAILSFYYPGCHVGYPKTKKGN